MTLEYKNVGNNCIKEGSRPVLAAAPMTLPEGVPWICNVPVTFLMKHLQMYTERKPSKKKTRRIAVRSAATGGAAVGFTVGGEGSVAIA